MTSGSHGSPHRCSRRLSRATSSSQLRRIAPHAFFLEATVWLPADYLRRSAQDLGSRSATRWEMPRILHRRAGRTIVPSPPARGSLSRVPQQGRIAFLHAFRPLRDKTMGSALYPDNAVSRVERAVVLSAIREGSRSPPNGHILVPTLPMRVPRKRHCLQVSVRPATGH